MRAALATTFAVLAAALPATASAADVPPGAAWSQATIPSTGGVSLHADVLRPKNLAPTRQDAGDPVDRPVLQPRRADRAGGTGGRHLVRPARPEHGPVGPLPGLREGAKLMDRGYTFVMVDLRGFGGSTGCLDWGGPGEQSDVVSAVQWAASQSWSTGTVGMYGKSYDGVTGLIGVDKRPAGLKAVVSQEPVYDLYRYLYGDGIRRENSLLTPALYDLIDATPGPARRRPELQRQRRRRHAAAGLQGCSTGRPGGQRRPLTRRTGGRAT